MSIYVVTTKKISLCVFVFFCCLTANLYADNSANDKMADTRSLDQYNIGQMLDGALHVSALEAATLLQQNSNARILDVRTPEEYRQGHINGATLLNYKSKDFAEKLETLDKGTTWIMHCRSGRRSAAAMELMKSSGFDSLVHMDGGFNSWENAGLEFIE